MRVGPFGVAVGELAIPDANAQACKYQAQFETFLLETNGRWLILHSWIRTHRCTSLFWRFGVSEMYKEQEIVWIPPEHIWEYRGQLDDVIEKYTVSWLIQSVRYT